MPEKSHDTTFSDPMFCFLQQVHCNDIILEDTDIPKAIIEFVSNAAIEKLVLGAPSRSGFVR